ncbi:MAG: hypothetical protein JNL74_05925 [Fibrobacteres bacterium]|nr:hypothetical protein [Fibrobacterota bacterium]
MFGSAPGCYNADGIKLDFTGELPNPGTAQCTRPLHGMEYLHTQLSAIHDAAKRAKADCLLDFQVANPHFASLYDMTRLNDFFLPGNQALRVMSTRAKIASSVGFDALVDMDGPRDEEYFLNMHKFGNVSLYLNQEDIKKSSFVTAIKAGIQRLD